jgi:hypothetical protein
MCVYSGGSENLLFTRKEGFRFPPNPPSLSKKSGAPYDGERRVLHASLGVLRSGYMGKFSATSPTRLVSKNVALSH